MWMFLLACTALEALTQPAPPPPSPTPLPIREGVIGYGVVIDSPGTRPWGDELPSNDLLFSNVTALSPTSVSATLLLNPDHPWMDRVVASAATDHRSVSLLQGALASTEACEAAMERKPPVPWEALTQCPFTLRDAILANYPALEAQEAFALTPLPDALAALYARGEQSPFADAFRHPESHVRIAQASERCIADRTESISACVEGLAMAGWDRATAHAEHLPPASPLRTALEAYGTEQALDARLHALGFEGAAGPGDVVRRLWNGGYVFSANDTPFAELLRMLDVRDVDLSITYSQHDSKAVVYVYSKGQRTRLLTDAPTQAEQLIGFANLLARRQERPHRALWVDDPQWGPLAIVGPTENLESLVDEGLVRLPVPANVPVDTGAPPFLPEGDL